MGGWVGGVRTLGALHMMVPLLSPLCMPLITYIQLCAPVYLFAATWIVQMSWLEVTGRRGSKYADLASRKPVPVPVPVPGIFALKMVELQ